MTWYFDSHIHLSDYDNSIQTLELAKKSNLILPFIGIHPECANEELENISKLIEDNHDHISGIGEIGLDPTYVNKNEDAVKQNHVFETLLSFAEKFDKPVSIHSRKSLDDVFEIMTSYDTKHALLHWFDGSKKQLQKAMDMGFFVSYGPVMIYANDKQTLLSKTDESQILVETDGPVRFSRCFDMKSGQISFIPSVIFCASKILGKSFDDMASLLESNSNSFLGI
jgi:TatD DNase family protein